MTPISIPPTKNFWRRSRLPPTELVVDLLRDPYDADYIKAGVACLTDFGWRACQLKAAIEKICSTALAPSAFLE